MARRVHGTPRRSCRRVPLPSLGGVPRLLLLQAGLKTGAVAVGLGRSSLPAACAISIGRLRPMNWRAPCGKAFKISPYRIEKENTPPERIPSHAHARYPHRTTGRHAKPRYSPLSLSWPLRLMRRGPGYAVAPRIVSAWVLDLNTRIPPMCWPPMCVLCRQIVFAMLCIPP